MSCRVWVFNLNNVQIPVAHLMHNHAERWPDATRTIQLAVSKSIANDVDVLSSWFGSGPEGKQKKPTIPGAHWHHPNRPRILDRRAAKALVDLVHSSLQKY